MTPRMHAGEVDLFRSLKKTAIVLMLLFRLDKPVGECEIAGILGMDRGTIRSYLRSLARQGMVTRSHRFHGWILTAGGRQMVLGESTYERLEAQVSEGRPMVEDPPSVMVEKPPSLPVTAAHAGAMAEFTSSRVENTPSMMVENPSSLPPTKPEAGAMVKNPPSMAENPSSSSENRSTMVENPPSLPATTAQVGARVENPPSMVENPSLSAENPPSAPLAAASLSLNSLSLKAIAAAAKAGASGKKYRSSAKFSRSRLRPRFRKIKKEDRTANENRRCEPAFRANLEAFASIGLVQNDFISGICQMEHVTPGYILGQKKRLEAEHRYSGGLLLNVVKCRDDLPEKYVVENPPQPPLIRGEQNRPDQRSPLSSPLPLERGEQNPPRPPLIRGEQIQAQLLEDETEFEEEDAGFEIELDSSIHEPLSRGGMTAARAWAAVLRELQTDMPKSAYDKWVRNAVILSAKDGTFVIGAHSGYAREWLESRLTSTITRLLIGICNGSVEVKFIDLNYLADQECLPDGLELSRSAAEARFHSHASQTAGKPPSTVARQASRLQRVVGQPTVCD